MNFFCRKKRKIQEKYLNQLSKYYNPDGFFNVFIAMMPKLYCTTGTARLLIASILFLPLNSYYNNNNYCHYSFLPSFLILLHSRMAKIKFGLGHVLKLIKL